MIPHKLYRISWVADNRELRGRPAVFLGWRERNHFDPRRARVDIDGEIWFVSPGLLIAW